MKRKPKIVLPAKYILLILTVVCVAAMITSFTLNISGGPLNAVAGYVFVPMQRGINTVGAWITEKADNLKNLSDVMAGSDKKRGREFKAGRENLAAYSGVCERTKGEDRH